MAQERAEKRPGIHVAVDASSTRPGRMSGTWDLTINGHHGRKGKTGQSWRVKYRGRLDCQVNTSHGVTIRVSVKYSIVKYATDWIAGWCVCRDCVCLFLAGAVDALLHELSRLL